MQGRNAWIDNKSAINDSYINTHLIWRFMQFNSIAFIFVFLPLFLAVFKLVQAKSPHRILSVMGAASVLFYAAWSPYYLALLFALAGINYGIGLRLQAQKSRSWLSAGIFLNVLNLAFFKYYYFASDTLHSIAGLQFPAAHIILPLGISFFTFQKIAYLCDCYRGSWKGKSFSEFFVFVFFFPQLIAGPIVHADQLIPQLRTATTNAANLYEGLVLFSIGLFKKAVLADTLASYVTPAFAMTETGQTIDAANAWFAVLSFSLQIYFDFSGYTDMARGLAKMIGITLPINFNSPYQSKSIIEFWRRWHITLSHWLRDYLYFPLGGARAGALKKYRNIAITMLLGGLWHGAGWTYVLWGAIHGALLILNHFWRSTISGAKLRQLAASKPYSLLCLVLTFIVVTLAWIAFRAPSLKGAQYMTRSLFDHNDHWMEHVPSLLSFLVLLGALLGVVMFKNSNHLLERCARGTYTQMVMAVASAALFVCSIGLMSKGTPFIYFLF